MAAISENQRKYLTAMAGGKTETGAAAGAGQQAWAKAQLAKAPAAAPVPSVQSAPAVSPRVQTYAQSMNGAGAAGQIATPVSRADQTIGQIQDIANKPFTYDQNSDPAYQAALATARQNITQQQSDTNARLRASGQGKSSYSESVANQIGANEMARVSTEVLPQLISQAYQREQDRIANLRGVYGMQNEQDFSNKVTEAGLTGNYLPDQTRQYINNLVNFKAETERNWSSMSPEQQAAARQEGDRVRSILQSMGVDPSLYGADVTSQTAQGNISQSGRTLDAQQLDYSKATDQRNYDRSVLESDRSYGAQQAQQDWSNNFQQGQFDWQKAQKVWENAFQDKSFQQSVQEAAASRGLQWASLNQREREFVADQAFKDKQFEYQKGQDALKQAAPGNYDFKTDPAFGEDIAWINTNPSKAVAEIRLNSEELTAQYGYDGYQELLKAAEAAQPKDQNQFLIPQ